jgi:hypothetical protein
MTIKETVSFKVNPSHYDLSGGGAVIVWCFDDRFNEVGNSILDAFIEKMDWRHKDLVTEPGGARVLASKEASDAAERRSLLNRIKSGIKLHNAKTVVLSVHIDCGGYGYSKSFPNGTEENKLASDLIDAENFIRKDIPEDTNIESYIVKMDGLYRVYP